MTRQSIHFYLPPLQGAGRQFSRDVNAAARRAWLHVNMLSLHMFRQIVARLESSLANRTRVFAVHLVDFLMMFQVRLLVKVAPARFATEWPLSRVHEHVIPQISLLVESFAARDACMLLACAVRAHVHLQGGRTVEGFPTCLALMGLVVRVDYFVPT